MSVDNLKNRNFGLDLMRFCAIAFVLLHHWTAYNLSNLPVFKDYIYYMSVFGYLGVEIFFVLSGFLIGNIIIKSYCNEVVYGKQSILTFWMRRWLRTLPLYYLILFVYIAVICIKHTLFPGLWKYFLFLQNIFKYDTSNNDFYGVSWSLSVEEWFYLSFPVLLISANFFLKKILSRKYIILSVIVFYIVVSLIIRVAYVYIEDPSWNNVLRKAVICREDSIAFGVLGALINNFRKHLFNKYRIVLFIAGALLCVFCTSVFLRDISYNYYYGLGTVSFFSKTFLFTLVSTSVLMMLPYCYSINCSNPFVRAAITHVSKISYSLYLIHLFFDQALQKIFPYHTPLILLVKLICFLLFSIIASTISFNFVENYFLKIRDRIWEEKYKAT